MKETENKKENNTPVESSDYSFIQEQIKERPINRRKLMRKMMITGGTAVVFGLVACLTFLLLEPVFGKIISDEDEIVLQQVTLPEESEENVERPEVSISPEEMLEVEETPIEDMNLIDPEVVSQNETVSQNEAMPEPEIELDDYRLLYQKLYALSAEVEKCMVNVTGISADVDWMDTEYLEGNSTAGVIIADNGYEYLILADSTNLEGAESLQVTFCDGTSEEATLKMEDPNTNLAVYAVWMNRVDAATREVITTATLGSSYSSILLGDAIVAVGNPLGSVNSVCYGAVTSVDGTVAFADATYQFITTDIYGSPEASGVIVNMRGQVIGIICQDYNDENMENLISAYGISSIRSMIEELSNSEERAYFGITMAAVNSAAREAYGIPEGVYVSDVDMNSPAMNSGISRGDIITVMNGLPLHDSSGYMQVLGNCAPGDVISVTVSRLNGEEYSEMTIDVELGAW